MCGSGRLGLASFRWRGRRQGYLLFKVCKPKLGKEQTYPMRLVVCH